MAILGTGAMARHWAYRLGAVNPWLVGSVAPPYRVVEGSRFDRPLNPPYYHWDESPPSSPDIVLLAIKWRRMNEAVRWISRHARRSVVISLINGLGQDQALASVPGITLAQGTTTAAVTQHDRTIYIRSRGRTILPITEDPRQAVLETTSVRFGWNWIWVTATEMRELSWQKLLQNCIINPLTALADVKNGQLFQHPISRLAKPLMEEALVIAHAEAVTVPGDMLDRVERLAWDTADNLSSMAQDVRAGLGTEVDAINGYLLGRARAHGLAAPTHQAVVRLIKELSGSGEPSPYAMG